MEFGYQNQYQLQPLRNSGKVLKYETIPVVILAEVLMEKLLLLCFLYYTEGKRFVTRMIRFVASLIFGIESQPLTDLIYR